MRSVTTFHRFCVTEDFHTFAFPVHLPIESSRHISPGKRFHAGQACFRSRLA